MLLATGVAGCSFRTLPVSQLTARGAEASGGHAAITPVFKFFHLTKGSFPTHVGFGRGGKVWFDLGFPPPSGGRILPDGSISYVNFHRIGIGDFTLGPDGRLWFTWGSGIGTIAKNGPRFFTPFASLGGGVPVGIVSGPNKHLWLILAGRYPGNSSLVEVNTNGKVVQRYVIPWTCYTFFDMVVGADGNLWADTEINPYGGPGAPCPASENPGIIVRMTPTGKMRSFVLPSFATYGITLGPDGNVWFTLVGPHWLVGKITPRGTVTTFPVSAAPDGITTAHDGTLWFAEPYVGKIANITTAGTITEFQVPGTKTNGGSTLQIIKPATDSQGNIWFTEPFYNTIGKLSY